MISMTWRSGEQRTSFGAVKKLGNIVIYDHDSFEYDSDWENLGWEVVGSKIAKTCRNTKVLLGGWIFHKSLTGETTKGYFNEGRRHPTTCESERFQEMVGVKIIFCCMILIENPPKKRPLP